MGQICDVANGRVEPLFNPGSDRAAESWRENYRIPGYESLELHHLYRAMARLGERTGKSSELPTAQCRINDQIKEQLFDRNRDLCSGWRSNRNASVRRTPHH